MPRNVVLLSLLKSVLPVASISFSSILSTWTFSVLTVLAASSSSPALLPSGYRADVSCSSSNCLRETQICGPFVLRLSLVSVGPIVALVPIVNYQRRHPLPSSPIVAVVHHRHHHSSPVPDLMGHRGCPVSFPSAHTWTWITTTRKGDYYAPRRPNRCG